MRQLGKLAARHSLSPKKQTELNWDERGETEKSLSHSPVRVGQCRTLDYITTHSHFQRVLSPAEMLRRIRLVAPADVAQQLHLMLHLMQRLQLHKLHSLGRLLRLICILVFFFFCFFCFLFFALAIKNAAAVSKFAAILALFCSSKRFRCAQVKKMNVKTHRDNTILHRQSDTLDVNKIER